MIKKTILAIFVLILFIYSLEYFQLLPSDRTLGINKVSQRQIDKINTFSTKEKVENQIPTKFTDRVTKTP